MTRPVLRAEDRWWLAVEDAGAAGAVRRAALMIADEVGLPEPRVADLAIVSTELATNLHRHARAGTMLVRAVRRDGTTGVELVAVDRGPGMRDFGASTRDGQSTAGTLGLGLGSVLRKASEVDAYSLVGRGTVVAATVWPVGVPAAVHPLARVAGVSRPMSGEALNGDSYAARGIDGGLQVMVCDGLGHGPPAAHAAMIATSAFCDGPASGPSAAVEHIHRALRHTRGVVITVVELPVGQPAAHVAGLGNIGGAVVSGARRHWVVGQPGIAGHHRPKLREVRLDFPAGSVLVLHSDGLTDRWDLSDYPGLASRSPVLIAATLLRDAGTRRDDAAVLVAKGAPR